MNKFILFSAFTLLSACSSTETSSKQETYTLYNSADIPLSNHQNYNNCLAASIRGNIRRTNDWNASNKPHQRAPIQKISKQKVTCKKA